ncbi:hypothetical protein [Parasediminibacterium sp. JCM 36343]|uniref:hypothetical protein n=1 Tax=Parasediminibacterium sp. JCM 36343 TaxID=3374279 RepID=UPI00397E0A5E
MNIAKQIPAFLLGFIFLVFGADFFIHFMPKHEMPGGDAGAFAGLLYKTGYLTVVKVLEVTIGALLFIKPVRALAMLLIAPIIINIMLFELCLAHAPGIGVGLFIINIIGIALNKEKYLGILA